MKIVGILILLVGALVFLIGLGGAVLNLVFPPEQLSCKLAGEHMKKADAAVKSYEAAKGTPDEIARKVEMDRAMKDAGVWNDSCGEVMESVRFNGLVFSGIAIAGVPIFLVGMGLTLLGFRKKKHA